MAKRTRTIEQVYGEIVRSWREGGIRSRHDLANALEEYRVQFAYNSGRIENPQITYHDTRNVFEDGRAVGYTGDVRTLFEIQNLKASHKQILDAFEKREPIGEKMVLDFHRTLTQGTYDEQRWARGERPGEYKHHDYVVGVHDTGAAAGDVPGLVAELIDELAQANEDNILTVAAYFHLVLEGIHPFADGNGRTGRALMNYLLLLHSHPPIIVFDDDKMAYYGAIETWDAEGDLSPMREFLKAECVKTWVRLLG